MCVCVCITLYATKPHTMWTLNAQAISTHSNGPDDSTAKQKHPRSYSCYYSCCRRCSFNLSSVVVDGPNHGTLVPYYTYIYGQSNATQTLRREKTRTQRRLDYLSLDPATGRFSVLVYGEIAKIRLSGTITHVPCRTPYPDSVTGIGPTRRRHGCCLNPRCLQHFSL